MSTRRLAIVLPPTLFLGLALIVIVGAPDLGTWVFYVVFAVPCVYALVHACRVGVELTEDEMRVNDQFRRHRIPLRKLRSARLEPLRTASPFKDRWPYVALAVTFTDDRTKQFQGISLSASHSAPLERLVGDINRRIAAQ